MPEDKLIELLKKTFIKARFELEETKPEILVWCSDSNAMVNITELASDIRKLKEG